MDYLREDFDWVPADAHTCLFSETLSLPAAISFLEKHIRKGIYKLELLKVVDLNFVKSQLKVMFAVYAMFNIHYLKMVVLAVYLMNDYM